MQPGDTVLDWGCGTGRAARKFHDHGMPTLMIDIADNCLDPIIKQIVNQEGAELHFINACIWEEEPFAEVGGDFSFACDVLEHIPEQHVHDVLRNIADCTAAYAYMQPHHRRDKWGTQGHDLELHLTVRPREWWTQQIERHFKIIEIHHEPDPRGQGGRTGYIAEARN